MCEGEGAGGAQRVTGRVAHLGVRGGVSAGECFIYNPEGYAGARQRELVLNGCTVSVECSWGGLPAPEPVGCLEGRRRREGCLPPVYAARRPWKGLGKGKVTGGLRVGKLQEFLHRI